MAECEEAESLTGGSERACTSMGMEMEERDETQEQEASFSVPLWCSTRLGLGVMSFFGYALTYLQRYNLSVAIVCMVNHTATDVRSLSGSMGNSSGVDNGTAGTCAGNSLLNKYDEDGTMVWSKETQGLLLAAYYWGYFVLQMPGGRLAEIFGAKRVIAISVVPVLLASVTSPVSANYSPWLLLGNRVVIGLATATMLPSFNVLWSRWAPTSERALLLGGCHAGGQFGLTVAYPLASVLCQQGFAGGWPSVFYTSCILQVVWLALWLVLAYDSPSQHPRISQRELLYLKHSVAGNSGSKKRHIPIPWKGIMTSSAFWSILVAHMAYNFLTYTISTNLPLYMKEVLRFDIESIGLLSILPLMMMWLATHLAGLSADKLIEAGALSVIATRKLFCVLGLLLPGVVLLGVGFVECQLWPVAMSLLCVGFFFCGFFLVSAVVNHCDIAPLLAGTLFGMTNTAAAATGVISPYLVNVITKDKTREQWQTVFYVTAGVSVLGAVQYLILGQATVQDWAVPPQDTSDSACESQGSLDTSNDVRSDKRSSDVTDSALTATDPSSETDSIPEKTAVSHLTKGSNSASQISESSDQTHPSIKEVAADIANAVLTSGSNDQGSAKKDSP